MKRFLLNKGFLLSLLIALPSGLVFAQASYQSADRVVSTASEGTQRARLHTELASMYFQIGRPAVALDELAIALESDSKYHPAYSVRGIVQASLKENAKAEADFKRALELAPTDPEVNNNYGWYLCETGKPRESLTYFLTALRSPLYETPEYAYGNAGTCAIKAGDLEGAQSYLLKALQAARDGAPTIRLALAKLFYLKGNLEESKVYFKEALRVMEPPSAEALWLGVRLERKLGNRGQESGYAAQLRSRYPVSPEYQDFLKGNFE
ncbi:MAG: type IV pilus biogenesis/stability protein PilW [Rhodocyclales bacterium]|nr:type IV pilus biogenesis/stability protein PilW [Rhodocyclales bacterium]